MITTPSGKNALSLTIWLVEYEGLMQPVVYLPEPYTAIPINGYPDIFHDGLRMKS